MVILIVLVIFWTPYVVTMLLRAQRARTPSSPGHPQLAHLELPIGATSDAGTQDVPGWGALDDRQLTRLLTNSAARSITE